MHKAGTTTTAMNMHSAGTTSATDVQTTDAMDQPVLSTSSAPGTAQTGLVITTEVHRSGTTKMDTEEWPSAGMLDHTTTIDNTDCQDMCVSLHPNSAPGLTTDEIAKILKRQPRICLTSSTLKPDEPRHTKTVTTNQCKKTLHSQSKITHTTTEKKHKPPKREVKRRSMADVVPSKGSAKCFKIQISQ